MLLVADGLSAHSRRLAEALVGSGVEVWLAAFERARVDAVRNVVLGGRPPEDGRRYILGIGALARAMRRIQPTIVHGHYVSSYGLMAAIALRVAHPMGRRPRLVQTAWGTDLLITARDSAVRRLAARVALRSANLITGDSSDLLSAARQLAPDVETRRFVFGPPSKLFEAPRSSQKVIISSRRLDPDTRVDHVVAAFRMAKELEPNLMQDWRLVVAGSGSEEHVVRSAAGGDSDVRFLGQLAGPDLAAVLQTAVVTVSIPISDASSAALLESMAAGVLPIVNDLPANREWVDDATGEFVPRDPDLPTLAAAVIRACQRRPDVDAIRARVRPVTWESEVAGLVNAYRALGEAPIAQGR